MPTWKVCEESGAVRFQQGEEINGKFVEAFKETKMFLWNTGHGGKE